MDVHRCDVPSRRTLAFGVSVWARDSEALGAWYREHLGVPLENGFAPFPWSDDDAEATTVWSPFEADTTHFGPSGQTSMTNFRVDDLGALLERLSADGVRIDPDRSDDEHGRFAWIFDLEGNGVELRKPRRRAR